MERGRNFNPDSLEMGFRVVDEVGSQTTTDREVEFRRRDRQQRRDSSSTREYGDTRVEDPSRMDAIERSITALARSVEHLRVNREHSQRPEPSRLLETPRYPTTPFSRHDRDAYVNDYMTREKMEIPSQEGKHTCDILTERKIPKPYMFIEKFGLDTLKKKMDYRSNITAQEYVNSFVRMLCDPRARDMAALPFQLAHLKDVTTDIVTRPWSAVRSWTQCVFDSIDSSAYSWPDAQQIQNDRFRLSFNGPTIDQPHESSGKNREVICTEFNNKCCSFGGKFKHHVENGVRFLHACLYCFAATGARRDHALGDPCNQRIRDKAPPHSHGPIHHALHPPHHPPHHHCCAASSAAIPAPECWLLGRPKVQATRFLPAPAECPGVAGIPAKSAPAGFKKRLIGAVAPGPNGDAPAHVSHFVYKQAAIPRSTATAAQSHLSCPPGFEHGRHQCGHNAPRVATGPPTAVPGSPDECAPNVPPAINFEHIRDLCEIDKSVCDVDLSPVSFAEHRRAAWPRLTPGQPTAGLHTMYTAVRNTGLPNAAGARLQLPTSLNIEAWQAHLKGLDDTLLDFVRYGFPMGYVGPVSDTLASDNHPSASQFPAQVDDFLEKEITLGGIVGPMQDPPFIEWCHLSPLMTRPKSDPRQRRVITDLTFPRHKSVNAYIRKNTVMGLTNTHSLPSVDAVVDRILALGPGASMFMLDISRAYTNFKSCPLDWPLLVLKWKEAFYVDITMPFGARASSGHMQRVADAIVAILAKKGVVAHMYLDDLVVVAKNTAEAESHYNITRALLAELGLPEALNKSQPPSSCIRWLGIDVDAAAGTLSVPRDKIEQALVLIDSHTKRRFITRRNLQSLLGKLLHVAKCVRPARLFVARLLDELRGPPRLRININTSMRSDLKWFTDFASAWNGVSVFPNPIPSREIVVDACLSGIGGASPQAAYAYDLSHHTPSFTNISELEAINVAIAIQTFIGPSDRGSTVAVLCDNMPAVQVFQSGRGKNHVILEAARAAWMVQALYQVNIVFHHIPGHLNTLADVLSP